MQKLLPLALIGMLLAGCGPTSDRSLQTVALDAWVDRLIKSPKSGSITVMEKRVHSQVNKYRASRNLPPLRLNTVMMEQARKHSQRMARKRKISHDGFDGRIKAINRRISYSSAAENVASNFGHDDPATVAVRGWIKSPGHHKNMIGDFDLTGIAIVKNNRGEYYFTQLFIKSRGSTSR
ncbi:MAG: CAP domain-containing protein [Cellvibrionales bacterium]|nr:CAP domain-containing protein [Cellvibrionales bacterium]